MKKILVILSIILSIFLYLKTTHKVNNNQTIEKINASIIVSKNKPVNKEESPKGQMRKEFQLISQSSTDSPKIIQKKITENDKRPIKPNDEGYYDNGIIVENSKNLIKKELRDLDKQYIYIPSNTLTNGDKQPFIKKRTSKIASHKKPVDEGRHSKDKTQLSKLDSQEVCKSSNLIRIKNNLDELQNRLIKLLELNPKNKKIIEKILDHYLETIKLNSKCQKINTRIELINKENYMIIEFTISID